LNKEPHPEKTSCFIILLDIWLSLTSTSSKYSFQQDLDSRTYAVHQNLIKRVISEIALGRCVFRKMACFL